VSVAACLLPFSLAVAVLGPLLLRRLTRGGHAPRLGVAVLVRLLILAALVLGRARCAAQ
jgi:hypothetical protein